MTNKNRRILSAYGLINERNLRYYRVIAFGLIFALIGTSLLVTGFASNPNLIGDENDDGVVDALDLSVLLSNWQISNKSVDLNGDGIVNILDMSILLGHWGQTGAVYPAPTVTLSASPGSITAGQSSTLSWSAVNASSCSAAWTSSTAVSGSQSVTPSATTGYTITCSGAGGSSSASKTVTVAAGSSGYTVTGKTIYDPNGNPHIFHGLDRPSLEWSATGDHLSLADYTLMRNNWKANVVRLSLNEKFWIQNTSGYQATVDQQVNWINSLGMDAILDLHWSDAGNINNTAAQQLMADQDSNTFWQQVAAKYKGNPKVLFELYNEPEGISWNVWRNGGPVSGFTAVGMQQLYNTVRATGANNLVLIGGVNWAFDLSGVANNRINGTNIVYNTHPYDYAGKNTAADWDKSFGWLTATDPVFMTEFGDYNCSTTLYSNVLTYAKNHNMSWSGWAWYPNGCGFPSLINDWTGSPTATGNIVKNAM